MRTLVFFLEEPSAEAMLKGVLPTLLPEDISPVYIIFEGKQDLEKQIVRKLRAWKTPDTLFIILRDQDSGDCLSIKENLQEKCKEAHKEETLIRIACRELESFYLGELSAVEKGLGIPGLGARQMERKFRDPDRLEKPSEELRRLTKGVYQKVSGSKAIGPFLSSDGSNRSHSFRVLITGIQDCVVPDL